MYNANGTPLAIAPTEFRVNATTAGNQVAPAVASNDPDEDSIVAWVGPDTKAAGTTAVFVRNIDPPFGTASAVVTKSIAPAISANPGNQSVKRRSDGQPHGHRDRHARPYGAVAKQHQWRLFVH